MMGPQVVGISCRTWRGEAVVRGTKGPITQSAMARNDICISLQLRAREWCIQSIMAYENSGGMPWEVGVLYDDLS